MSLRHAALGLLALRGEASGYDLLGIFNESLEHVWPATQSQLYTELGKLTDAELVEVVAEGGRGRKAYAVTEAGRKEFEHWLLEEPPTVNRRNDLLLRVFFLGLVPSERAQEFLRERAAASADMHERLRGVERSLVTEQGSLAVHGRLALEWGLRFSRMQSEWATWAAEQLAEAEPAPAAQVAVRQAAQPSE
ncbi:PadR family transcriptional regulator [Streptacidiphilus sp. MAP5-3]|jgi:PadR family transcriptional regulator AphA|uniref:PadR family transcriptional regulator n=1 Tax=unclassified Streptacidiphilus TaxID=2643834 RepID=UPI003518B6F8